jgi:hypothetical protein
VAVPNYNVVRNNRSGTPIAGGDREFITGTNGWGPAGDHTATFPVGGGDLGLLDSRDKYTQALHTIYAYNSSSVTCTDWSLWGNIGATNVSAQLEFDPGDENVRVWWP